MIFDLRDQRHQGHQVPQVSHVTMPILVSGTSGSIHGGYDDPGVPLSSKRGGHLGNLSRVSPMCRTAIPPVTNSGDPTHLVHAISTTSREARAASEPGDGRNQMPGPRLSLRFGG